MLHGYSPISLLAETETQCFFLFNLKQARKNVSQQKSFHLKICLYNVVVYILIILKRRRRGNGMVYGIVKASRLKKENHKK